MMRGTEIKKFSILSPLGKVLAYLGYAFLIVPTLIIIPLSFGDKDIFVFPPTDLSLRHYRSFFFESGWLAATEVSLKVAIAVTVLSLILGIGAAYGLSRTAFRGRKAVTILLLSPIFVPGIVIGLALYIYFARLDLAGTTLGLIIGHTVVVVPFVIVTINAGLRHVDRNLEIAGGIMGAKRLTVLRKITLPLLLPSIFAAALFSCLISFDEVVISYFIAEVQNQTLPVKMFNSIQWEISPVIAAISTMLTFVSLIVCIVSASLQREQ